MQCTGLDDLVSLASGNGIAGVSAPDTQVFLKNILGLHVQLLFSVFGRGA